MNNITKALLYCGGSFVASGLYGLVINDVGIGCWFIIWGCILGALGVIAGTWG